jgi:hypothetical protein
VWHLHHMSVRGDAIDSGMVLATINVIGLLLSRTEVLLITQNRRIRVATGRIRKDTQI